MRTRFWLSALLVVLLPGAAWAQQNVADPRVVDSISADEDAVTIASLPNGRGSAAISVVDFCTCTLVIEGKVGSTWNPIDGAPTIDGDGVYSVSAAGLDGIRVRASAWTMGTTGVGIRVSSAGGGGGAVGDITLEGEVMVGAQPPDDPHSVVCSNGSIAAPCEVTATNLDVQSGGADLLSLSAFNSAFGTAGAADSQVMSVQGVASMTPLQVQSNSANIATETTAAAILTSTNFAAAFGTAGTADTQVLSIQGIASMTPVIVSATNLDVQIGGSDTVTVSASNLDVQSGGADLLTEATGAGILTSANFAAAFGTAGAPDTQVMSVQGRSGMTPLDVDCSNCTGTGVSADDGDAFMAADPFVPVGGLYDSSPAACADGDKCMAIISEYRALSVYLSNPSTGAALTQDTQAVFGGAATWTAGSVPTGGFGTWCRVSAAAPSTTGIIDDDVVIPWCAATGAIQIQSNAADLLTETTGAAILTSTNFAAAFGTAGSADSQVMSVQGVASMTPLLSRPVGFATGGGAAIVAVSDNSDNEDEHAVCTADCTIYSVTAFNHAATTAFLRCEMDTAGNTTPGSETASSNEPNLEIPGATTGAGVTINFGAIGVAYTTALTCWVVTEEAATGTTDVGENDVRVMWVRAQ